MMLTYIAGVNYRPGARDKLASMIDGEALRLVRQPENPYDKNAVAVYDGGVHLGYVPAVDAVTIAKAMDQGLKVSAVVNRVSATTGMEIEWTSN